MKNEVEVKHLMQGEPLQKRREKELAKWIERFGRQPDVEIWNEILVHLSRKYRLSTYMGYHAYGPRSRTKTVTAYHWVTAGKNKRGHTVRFCWSRYRNEAGFFLAWQETVKGKGQIIHTRKWSARRIKKKAKELCHKRVMKWRENNAEAE